VLKKYKRIMLIGAGLAIVAVVPLIIIAVQSSGREEPVIPQSYWVIGPFGPGMHRSYEPEKNPDPARPCRTSSGEELHWFVHPVIADYDCLDFRQAFRQNTNDTVGYALVYIHSPREQGGELLLGSDDTITVWVNGQQVHQNTRLRAGKPDDDRAFVKWEPGWNTMLIKVGNKTGDHLFFAKLSGSTGLRASAAKD
jgi:hypothetical protein